MDRSAFVRHARSVHLTLVLVSAVLLAGQRIAQPSVSSRADTQMKVVIGVRDQVARNARLFQEHAAERVAEFERMPGELRRPPPSVIVRLARFEDITKVRVWLDIPDVLIPTDTTFPFDYWPGVSDRWHVDDVQLRIPATLDEFRLFWEAFSWRRTVGIPDYFGPTIGFAQYSSLPPEEGRGRLTTWDVERGSFGGMGSSARSVSLGESVHWEPDDSSSVDAEVTLSLLTSEPGDGGINLGRSLLGQARPVLNSSGTGTTWVPLGRERPADGDIRAMSSVSAAAVPLDFQAFLLRRVGGQLNEGIMSDAFPDLASVAARLGSLPLDTLAAIVSDLAAEAPPLLEPAGIPVPVDAIATWGVALVLLIQLYLGIQIRALPTAHQPDSEPFIVLLPGGGAHAFAAALMMVPVVTVSVLLLADPNHPISAGRILVSVAVIAFSLAVAIDGLKQARGRIPLT